MEQQSMKEMGDDSRGTQVQQTALLEAVRQGNTEEVKILLDAGAQSQTSDRSQNLIAVALQNYECPTDLIELLLKHGVSPNDHDGKALTMMVQYDNKAKYVYTTAVHDAASRGWTEGVRMLLEAGAKSISSDRLENLVMKNRDCPQEVTELLLKHGAVNCEVLGAPPLLHRILYYHGTGHLKLFNLEKLLDLFFLHGGNIYIQDVLDGTALQFASIERYHGNTVRWLIRHGAEVLLPRVPVEDYKFYGKDPFPALFLLLQAGMRVSHEAHTLLSNMEVELSTLLKEGTSPDYVFVECFFPLWTKLFNIQGNFQTTPFKTTFTDHQMSDLLQFSDKSLGVYPDDFISNFDCRKRLHKYQVVLDHLRRVLEFLYEPKSLQWYCRLCVRDNLVSLQPSVVKTLPIPSRLKRYILCHEI